MSLEDFENFEKSLKNCYQTIQYEQTSIRQKNQRVMTNYRLRKAFAIFLRELQANTKDTQKRLSYLLKVTYSADEQLAVIRLAYLKTYNYDINREYVKKKELERKVYELYTQKNMTIKEIAKLLNISYEKARKIIRKYDKKTRKYNRLTDIEIEFIKQFILMNNKISEIATVMNKNTSTIYYAVKRLSR